MPEIPICLVCEETIRFDDEDYVMVPAHHQFKFGEYAHADCWDKHRADLAAADTTDAPVKGNATS